MNRKDDPSSNDATEIANALASAPVPEGLARRAIQKWQGQSRERSRSEPRTTRSDWLRLPRLNAFMRPIVLGAAAVLLLTVVIRHRIGMEHPALRDTDVPTTLARTRAPRSPAAVPQASSPAPSKTIVPQASSPASAKTIVPQASSPAPLVPQASSPAPLVPQASSPAPLVPQASSSAASEAAAREQPEANGPARKTTLQEARTALEPVAGVTRASHGGMALGSSADLAYLNGDDLPKGKSASDTGLEDPRLNTPVTLDEMDGSVPDLLGRLRSITGVQVSIDDDMARRSLAVVCTDRPLREVMRQMARALNLRWHRTGAGPASRYSAGAVALASAVPQASSPAPGPRADVLAASRPAAGKEAQSSDRMAADLIMGEPEGVRAVKSGQTGPFAVEHVEGWLIVRGI